MLFLFSEVVCYQYVLIKREIQLRHRAKPCMLLSNSYCCRSRLHTTRARASSWLPYREGKSRHSPDIAQVSSHGTPGTRDGGKRQTEEEEETDTERTNQKRGRRREQVGSLFPRYAFSTVSDRRRIPHRTTSWVTLTLGSHSITLLSPVPLFDQCRAISDSEDQARSTLPARVLHFPCLFLSGL